MFCPKCGAKYEEGVTACSECNVPLVNEPPGQTEPGFVRFVTVYETGDPALIAFAKSILQSEGIRYFVGGESLQDLFAGGRLGTGFNPVIGPVKIQVDEQDAEKAKELLRQIEHGKFELPETETSIKAEEVEPSRIKGHDFKNIVIGILIGILISVAAFIVYDYKQKHLSGVSKYDRNKDSKPDLIFYYENRVLVKTEEDRNFDGRMDAWYFYKDRIVDHGSEDNNFDGVAETWFKYKNGVLVRLEIDTNSDNKPEIIEYYTNGVISEKLWIHESNRKPWKRALFEGGIMGEEYIDRDYDGTFDIKTSYDSSERPIKTESLH